MRVILPMDGSCCGSLGRTGVFASTYLLHRSECSKLRYQSVVSG